ncbi:MAG: hypothetical protein L6263_03080, partial [Desulfobacteraceae bacterium]|nr:hypothetical protein [Desulfobacteraceae bacterium]
MTWSGAKDDENKCFLKKQNIVTQVALEQALDIFLKEQNNMHVILNHYALGSGQKQAHRGFFASDKMPCMSRFVQIERVCLPAIALAQARRAGCRGRNRVFIFSFSKKYLIPALVSSALRHLL